MAEFTFRKKANGGYGYFVLDSERCIGFVIRREGWTVRGRPVYWEAYKAGKSVGRGTTREAAAKLLAA